MSTAAHAPAQRADFSRGLATADGGGAIPILIISPTPFIPCDAGNRVRISNLIDAVRAQGYAPHFLHVTREAGDGDAMASALGSAQFRAVPYQRPLRHESPARKLWRRLRQLFDRDLRYVWGIDDWYDPAISVAVRQWHQECNFVAVIVEYVFFSAVLEELPRDVLKVIDTHDRFAMRHRLYLERGMQPRFFSTTPDDEARGLSRADLVLAIQDEERAAFSRTTRADVVTVGHLVTLEDCFRADRSGAAPSLLIVGSENEINVDGLLWFLKECWPAIQAALPQAQLHIVGGLAKAAPAIPGVTPVGFLPHLADAYRQAHIVINPVRSGTGLNIKSIEALGYGMPLVATNAGSRGLESASGQAFMCADSAQAMVQAVQDLWHSPESASALGRAGQDLARRWNDESVQNLCAALQTAADRRRLSAEKSI